LCSILSTVGKSAVSAILNAIQQNFALSVANCMLKKKTAGVSFWHILHTLERYAIDNVNK